MTKEIAMPKDVRELRTEWGRGSLRHEWKRLREGEPPGYILSNTNARAAFKELCEANEHALTDLKRIAEQALRYYSTGADYEAALESFTIGTLFTFPGVAELLEGHAQYLGRLIAHSMGDPERFKTLLQLFIELVPQDDRR